MWNIWTKSATSRALGVTALGLGLAFAGGAAAQTQQIAQASAPSPAATFDSVPLTDADHILGNKDAPVTIIEYASFTCPHCAEFHSAVLPKVKKAYIDTGKARLVFRDFPLDRIALAGSMLARCSGKDRYFGFVDLLFKDQRRWAGAQNPVSALGQLARLGGMSKERFESCLKDETVQKTVLQQRLTATQKYQVNSTPTLIINGKQYRGGLSFEQIKAVIEPILSKS